MVDETTRKKWKKEDTARKDSEWPKDKKLKSWYEEQTANQPEDKIQFPEHYVFEGLELIGFQQMVLATIPNGYEGWLLGKILGYLCRYNRKNGMEDIEKARWYLNKLAEAVEGRLKVGPKATA